MNNDIFDELLAETKEKLNRTNNLITSLNKESEENIKNAQNNEIKISQNKKNKIIVPLIIGLLGIGGFIFVKKKGMI